jgi:hypothetical protein
MPKVGFQDAFALASVALTIVLLVLDKAGKLKGPLLLVLLAVAAMMMLPVALGNSWVQDARTTALMVSRGLLAVFLIGLIYSLLAIWISSEEAPLESSVKPDDKQEGRKESLTPPKPSLLFIFGAPLGDNNSSEWIMMVKHFGPGTAYNCDIGFYDGDRKNIEHEWLVKHPHSPFPPPGIAGGDSQKWMNVPEAGPEGLTPKFRWTPINPNSQHYGATISCRDGVFEETWEITRVDGVLRSKITLSHGAQWIKNNPSLEPVIFRYQDPEFISTALATEVPKSPTAKVVHPGWKPSHRFEVPAAIIDPNGNVQVLTGVKAPDGSTVTDFGSWNILTKHYGD